MLLLTFLLVSLVLVCDFVILDKTLVVLEVDWVILDVLLEIFDVQKESKH